MRAGRGFGEKCRQRHVQGRDDRQRHVRRRHQALPGIRLIAGKPGFEQGRHVGQGLDPSADGDAERFHAALSHQPGHRSNIAEHDRYMAGYHIAKRRTAAAIWNVPDVGAGHALEQFHIDVMRRAHPARRITELARPRLGELDQVGHRTDGQRRVHHQHERHCGDQRDRRKIHQRIVGQFLVDARVEGQRGARGRQQRVAVGRGARHISAAGGGPLPRTILDDERLAQSPFEALRQVSRQRVGPAAGRVRNHDANGLGWIILDCGILAGGGAESGKTKGAGDGALEYCPGPMRQHRIALRIGERSALHQDRSGALRALAFAHDAEALGDLGVGLDQPAEVAAEAVLVELLVRLDVPQPAGIRARSRRPPRSASGRSPTAGRTPS